MSDRHQPGTPIGIVRNPHPLPVLYLDYENYPPEGKDRENEHLKMFSAEQRQLIAKNLYTVYMAPLADAGTNIRFDNASLFKRLGEGRKVVYADCLYKMHDFAPSKGIEQRQALKQFWGYFPSAIGKYALHHVGRESSESLLKIKPAGLRELGAERWSEKISDSHSILKEAGTVICQEKRMTDSPDGEEEVVDMQIYGNGFQTSPVVRFRQEFEQDGVDLKYRWVHKPVLSDTAHLIYKRLKGFGPWDSKNQILKDYGYKDGKSYRALQELTYAGLLRKDGGQYGIHEPNSDVDFNETAKAPENVERAVNFLRAYLVQAMAESDLNALAEQHRIVLGNPALYREAGVSVHLDKETGKRVWAMSKAKAKGDEDVHRAKVKEVFERNPKTTLEEASRLIGISKMSVSRHKKALGLAKQYH